MKQEYITIKRYIYILCYKKELFLFEYFIEEEIP
ncbi:Uncharacterised protein [Aggregatibacter actinomycetemcomitans]|nr:Uncharacterised protein [Aggregatibacter actinomycetemcomitans]